MGQAKKDVKTGSKKNTAKQLPKNTISANQTEIIRMSNELRNLKLLNDQLKTFINYLKKEEEELEKKEEETREELRDERRKIAALEEKLRNNEAHKEAVQREFKIDRQNKLEGMATWNVMDNKIDIEGWVQVILHRTKVFNKYLLITDVKERFVEPLKWPSVSLPDPFPNYTSYIECN